MIFPGGIGYRAGGAQPGAEASQGSSTVRADSHGHEVPPLDPEAVEAPTLGAGNRFLPALQAEGFRRRWRCPSGPE